MSTLVAIENVGFRYDGTAVLEDVNLTVRAGDFLGLIGPNGSGKTTLLKIILGLLTPTAGRVRLFGASPADFREWHRVGYVPQRALLDPALPATVQEVVATGLVPSLGLFGRAGPSGRARVREALRLVGMEAHAGVRIGALSAGQQQRVLIARALVLEPALLLLDEPTGGVDPEAQGTFHSLLRHLNHERRVTLILVSHDIGVVTREVTRLACLNRRLVFHGPPGEFLSDAALSALYGHSVGVVAHDHP
jgi:zinc transport system ATP-binding protein